MAINLSRNSRVFFTTNVNQSTGILNNSAFSATDTFELQVLDGFSFTQNTNTETVTVNEAGAAPIRGQRSFNTSLAPVDFSFSTYVRPEKTGTPLVTCEEAPLWKALATVNGTGWTETSSNAKLQLVNSNSNQLQRFALFFVLDNVSYMIENCAMNQVTLDFGIDQIATLQWTGVGARLVQFSTTIPSAGFAGGAVKNGTNTTVTLSGTYLAKNTAADYISNKLTTATLVGTSPTVLSTVVPITGGSLTYNNNIQFLTPTNLGVVNAPITYFSGTRSITGNLTAYLRTGGTDTGAILNTMLSNTNITESNFSVTVNVGGTSANSYVTLAMPTASLQIPTIDIQQVVSTNIQFTAQPSAAGTAGSAFDLTTANELEVIYNVTA